MKTKTQLFVIHLLRCSGMLAVIAPFMYPLIQEILYLPKINDKYGVCSIIFGGGLVCIANKINVGKFLDPEVDSWL